MTFFFGFLDLLLTSVLIYDTLGIVYAIRKGNQCEDKEYTRICFSWILFLSISYYISCDRKGFFGTLIRLILFEAKAFVVLPILGGTSKINKFLFEDGNAEKYYKQAKDFIQSKIGSKVKFHSS